MSEEPHKIISHAAEVATAVVAKAEEVAKKVAEESEDRNTQSLIEALRQVFGENEDAKRFIDISKIPLICKSIIDIHENLDDIKDMIKENREMFTTKDQFWPVKTLVYGFVGTVLLAVVGALIALVLNK